MMTGCDPRDQPDSAMEPSLATNWVRPSAGAPISPDRLIADVAGRRVVLLGEHHDAVDHHRWQLHTLAALHGRQPDMILGFEMFPRRVQPVLDRWVAGELTEEQFLDEVGWDAIWGFDPGLYMPLLQFARLHRVPMLALNVDRALVARVAREGWDAVPEDLREGVWTPADPPEDYRRYLAEVFAMKRQHGVGGAAHEAPATADPGALAAEPAFGRFVQAQLTWDRAMAQALAAAAGVRPDGSWPLVVGIVGLGHVQYGWGVPHQLADLDIGRRETAVLIPWRTTDRDALEAGIADAVFLLPAVRGR